MLETLRNGYEPLIVATEVVLIVQRLLCWFGFVLFMFRCSYLVHYSVETVFVVSLVFHYPFGAVRFYEGVASCSNGE